ncbi:MAG: pilus assembly protein PilM [Verrucomicrobiota bacterium]
MSDQIIAIDLGTRSTKAVCMEKDGDSLRLVSYTIQDRPDFGSALSLDGLSTHLTAVARALNAKSKQAIFVVGAKETVICHAEMPVIETSQMRRMVKLNPRLYFQEDLPNHSFDCFVLHQEGDAKTGSKQVVRGKTLIVGIKNQVLKNLQAAAAASTLDVEQVTASQTGSANCFLMSPEVWQKKVVALVDIGFSHSTISLLVNGEITLTRVVNIGAEKFTSGLAESMNITFSVAEGLKQIMPQKVHSQLTTLVAPLSHELNNSIHFFEQKADKKVSEIYFSGGSARSTFIIEILQAELHLPCKSWDPTSSLTQKLSSAQAIALQQEAPQLTVAIGAALTWFKPTLPAIDLLAEEKEEAELRSRDPMRRGYALAGVMAAVMLIWYSFVFFGSQQAASKIGKLTAQLNALQPKFVGAETDVKKSGTVQITLRSLENLSTNRFLMAPALNALQFAVVDNFEVVHLLVAKEYLETKAIAAVTNQNNRVTRAVPAETIEQTILTIQAKSIAKPSAAEKFMETLTQSPWFKANLRSQDPIRLRETQAAQVDPADPNRISILFTVECYAERKL